MSKSAHSQHRQDAVAAQLEQTERIPVQAGHFEFIVERTCNLDTLWDALGRDDFGDDERIPYWAELWPAAVGMARWLCAHEDALPNRAVLEAGCGLGLSAVTAAALGARVVCFDYEPEAVGHTRRNLAVNRVNAAAVVMDWRRPSVTPGAFDLVLGADILYEKRFVTPLAELFAQVLAPGGRVWLAEPEREVSNPAMYRFLDLGFRHRRLHFEKISLLGKNMGIHIIELTRKGV
jgi:predicted nicotinamide N-methyase